ncbi:MAG: DUF2254 domain-containing protein [Planctomycetes bacterium]|nr:DUF2254 domain-containing protein [Planctomycetota bacterium]
MQRLLTTVGGLLVLGLLALMGRELAQNLGPALFEPTRQGADLAAVVSNLSRVLGVVLSMIVALCSIAVPLTANVYTPKLIEIFVADRTNRVVVAFYVLANALVAWNMYVIEDAGPDGARARTFLSLGVTMVALVGIGPYIYYILKFLIPRNIVRNLEREVLEDFATAARSRDDEELAAARAGALENIKYLGNIVLRSVDRYDRDTAFEGLRALRAVFDAYETRKDQLPPGWFDLREAELNAIGPELGREVERKRAAIEVAILLELSLVLPLAIARLPEIVAQVASLTRRFGVRTAERQDVGAREMVTLFFNTFLRAALQHKSSDAFYKFVYQARRFAEEELDVDPEHAQKVAFFLDYYGHQAVRMGMGYLINVVAYDLASLTDLAYRKESPCRRAVLELLLQLDRDSDGLLQMPGVMKAQVILAAKLHTRGEEEPVRAIVAELKKVPPARLEEAYAQIVSAHDEHFWEIADRRRHLDHVEAEFRGAIEQLRAELLGPRAPGTATQRFLKTPEAAAGRRSIERHGPALRQRRPTSAVQHEPPPVLGRPPSQRLTPPGSSTGEATPPPAEPSS